MSNARREHMTETFLAVSDALRRSIVPTYGLVMKSVPNLPRPWYLPEEPPQTVNEYRAALAKLGHLGLVKGGN